MHTPHRRAGTNEQGTHAGTRKRRKQFLGKRGKFAKTESRSSNAAQTRNARWYLRFGLREGSCQKRVGSGHVAPSLVLE
eukprot:3231266-Prymnesium_polylepis.1